MTWKHTAVIIAALALPLICGMTSTCAHESFIAICGLSTVAIASVMANANSAGPTTNNAAGSGTTNNAAGSVANNDNRKDTP